MRAALLISKHGKPMAERTDAYEWIIKLNRNAELFSVSRRASRPAIFQRPVQLQNGAKRKSNLRFASGKMPGRHFSASSKENLERRTGR